MPQARPLKPITHWRIRIAMFIAQGLRQGHVSIVVAKRQTASGDEPPDARNPRLLR